MMAARLDPMTIVNPCVEVEDSEPGWRTRGQDVFVTDTCLRGLAAMIGSSPTFSKLACSTTHRHGGRRDQRA